jgi:hypothetical protein
VLFSPWHGHRKFFEHLMRRSFPEYEAKLRANALFFQISHLKIADRVSNAQD